MKKKLTDEQFESLLREAAPKLAAMQRTTLVLTPERAARLTERLSSVRAFSEHLTTEKLQLLIVQLLRHQPMDGSELLSRLSQARVRFDLLGEGQIYSLLYLLEEEGLIEGMEAAGETRVLRIYHLTSKGKNLASVSVDQDSFIAALGKLILAS